MPQRWSPSHFMPDSSPEERSVNAATLEQKEREGVQHGTGKKGETSEYLWYPLMLHAEALPQSPSGTLSVPAGTVCF